MNEIDWKTLTEDEKTQKLFEKQKQLLDTFLAHHTISRAQYDKSLGDLAVKMGIKKQGKEYEE